mmetsp:Transcript_27994/g.47029  ORF Transcript_27994/g.47029 Transcript_27994/m.47029 type:complete len:185 (-) Transcript_27994:89-643(-)
MEFIDELKEEAEKYNLAATRPLSEQEQEDLAVEHDLDDWEEEEEPIKSLFNNDMLPTVEDLVQHDLLMFKFDLKHQVSCHCKDDLDVIRLINYIRAKAELASSTGTGATGITEAFICTLVDEIEKRSFAVDETYLKPMIEGDPLLYSYEDTLFTVEDDVQELVPEVDTGGFKDTTGNTSADTMP